MSGIPDARDLEEMRLWRAFDDRMSELFQQDDEGRARLVRLLAEYAILARQVRRAAYEVWSRETERFEQAGERAADELGIDLKYEAPPDPAREMAGLWEQLDVFTGCEHTLMESAETADTLIRQLSDGSADADRPNR